MLNEKDNGFIDKYRGGTIRYKDLSYTFDDITYPLKNINLTILDGEKLVVIGKSGSGKSTLFKLLKGYYKVDKGLIVIYYMLIKMKYYLMIHFLIILN